MSQIQKLKVAPFLSIIILVAVGIMFVTVKMEVVRAGYEIVRLGHFHKIATEEHAGLQLTYARLTRPERLDEIGTKRLALNRAQKNQVVLMAATGSYAVRQ